MNVSWLNCFLDAALSVFHQVTGEPLALGVPALAHSNALLEPVGVLMGVTGALRGHVLFGFERAAAETVAARMLGTTHAVLDELGKSALGELANIALGNALMQLAEQGWRCDICPPAIIVGQLVEITGAVPRFIAVPLTSSLGGARLSIGLRECAAPSG